MTEWSAETAEWYAEKYGEYPTNRLAIDALSFEADATVVDIGCGTGAALRHAAGRVTDGALIGVDPVPRMVEIANERLEGHSAASRIRFVEAPAHSLPLGDASAHLVLALDSYDHWGEAHRAAGLAEVGRILAPGGQFAVVKDGAVAYSRTRERAVLAELAEAGFVVRSERSLEGPKVTAVTPESRETFSRSLINS